jgi:DNA-binding NarL/FixJ family response regulator
MDVFVVEDSAGLRQRLLAALGEAQGVETVGWAAGQDEAVAAIARLRPQFVILDLRLAQGSGLAVLEAVKQFVPPPIVAVLTNYPERQYRERCAELGADHFFYKAAGIDSLLETCRWAAEAGAMVPSEDEGNGTGPSRSHHN